MKLNKNIFKFDKYRLVTRSDFDGLVCAMILKEIGILDDIKFVHPKDVQDGKIELFENDITTNLPYSPNAGIVFDHHESEMKRNEDSLENQNYIIAEEKSAARVVYGYFKKFEENNELSRITQEIMDAVDKSDSAQFVKEEILKPKDWVLLSFLMDARTGLGRFHEFRISNYQLMMELIDLCLDHSIKEVLELPDVKERTKLYFEQQDLFKEQLKRLARVDGKVIILDLRNEETIYAGNRFYIYAMYPEVEISIHLTKGFKGQNTPIMIGKSIINRASDFDIGELCLKYGGGGHKNAGTCQVDNDKADEILEKIVKEINQTN
ncbi:exopolyphosphatase [Criibacterium bergeronii]|uniref:Exopolyphosphatase n=1 Tax=Criibacterium bergeronii TaxID=1871336 RepID=A0A552UVI2_9FIRM|nr:exopolyphosphatase [Criibacterium bergeronii]TRW22243.1 exopolyphosphatase [Criibacterium bergeronii]